MGSLSCDWGCNGSPHHLPGETDAGLSGCAWNLFNGTNGSAEVAPTRPAAVRLVVG